MNYNTGDAKDVSESMGTTLSNAKEEAEVRADEYRLKAADALHSGAEKVRHLGDRAPGQRTAAMGRQAGDRLEGAADYVEQHTLTQMFSDCAVWMKRNPGPSLAIAAATGFVVARALRR